MLITLQEDGILRIYRSVEEAVLDVEALDAEDTFANILDEAGQGYAIRWIRPNRRGRLLVQNGEYTLVPDGQPNVEALLKLIRGAQHVEPESAEPWLRALETRLASR